jgi:hypothetical protein
MGAEVEWRNETKTVVVVRDGVRVEMRLNAPTAIVDGSAVPLNTPAQLKAQTVLIPLRFVSEAFGVKVEWDEPARIVSITTRAGPPASNKATSVGDAALHD